MEGLPRLTRSSFKLSTMNFRNHSQTRSSSDSQREGAATPHSKDIPRKIKSFLYSLFGKRMKKLRSPKREEGYQTPLEELDVRKLIRLYCKHENLYNPKHSYYGNKEFAEDCYNDMARSIPGRSGFELRSCIEELRYLFEREYKVIESARQTTGEVLMPSIRYYNELLFLVPYLCMDSNKPHAESGTSSQNPKYVTKPADLPSNKLNNFTGFPLAAFPGNICCSPKEILKRTFKKDPKKETKGTKVSDPEKQQQNVTFSPSAEERLNDYVAGNRDSKVSVSSSNYGDEEDLKTTDLTCPLRLENSPCVSECRLPQAGQVLDSTSPTTSKPQESMKQAGKSHTPGVKHICVKSNSKNHSESSQRGNSGPAEQEICARQSIYSPINSVPTIPSKPKEPSVDSVIESTAAVEQEKFMMAHPPNSAGNKKSQMGVSGPEKKPNASSLPEEHKEAASEDKRDNPLVSKYQNFKQVQMLCDMIRTELVAAPDFIYFDAKWRIIEILREVHKRQLVHMKAKPHKNAVKQQLDQFKMQHPPCKPNKNLPPPPAKPAVSKISDHIRGRHCPYCCHNN